MNPRRKALVSMAFSKFDTDGSGTITIEDLQGVYDASHHPDVIKGKMTEEEALLEFLSHFRVDVPKNKLAPKTATQIITTADFERYYSNLSASIDDDDYFELMIRNAWHISGGEGWCANTTNKRSLVVDKATGKETVVETEGDPDV